jgi:glycine/D-amino acid oxidase-like deaminating enzyme/nitrite reductase/ring-hydroxylating ferredoxin subunit
MEESAKLSPRDSSSQSPWQAGVYSPAEQQLVTDVVDTIIVGAGITGITTALMLQKAGQKCIILEAGNVGFGTTGGTSAHLNTFFDATYPEIENDFGKEAAKQVADSGKEAFSIIKAFVDEYQIECDFEYKEGYLFSENKNETKQLKEILQSSANAGIAVEESKTNDVPIPFELAVKFSKQGQFHPLKYINGLADVFTALGGIILEHTFVSDSKTEEGIIEVTAGSRTLKAANLVYATHMPPGINAFSFRCAPYRSYVLGVRLKDGNYPTGLAYDMQEPYHYFRTHDIDGQPHLIIGGEDHKTGHDDPEQAFANLESYLNQYYQVDSVVYKWSSQYYVPADGLPYIGRLAASKDSTYIATGFNGNGMMFGTLSAKIISDQILGIENEYAELYSPSRLKPIAGFTDFVRENADVAWHFIADRFSMEALDAVSDLKTGEGKVAELQGTKLALYKDKDGKITALSPVCTHAGCIVDFNAAEQSWDCPCHGGRFDLSGKVVSGPPQKNLEHVQIPNKELNN